MVKKNRIAPKPTTPTKEADTWVEVGGIDPELQQPRVEEKPAIAQADEPEAEKPKGKPFPHRISFDTTKEQYKRLKRASFEEEQSLNEIIREAVEDWLKTRSY